MFFVWKGLGFWVFIITGICLVVSNSFLDSYQHHRSIAFLVAAIINWYFGKAVNKDTKKTYIDEKTKEKLEIDNSHTFFFIRPLS